MKPAGRPPNHTASEWAPFFDAVDEARRNRSFDALYALYTSSQSTRDRALLNSTACVLAAEFGETPAEWAMDPLELPKPWFVAGVESLKAMALVESPLPFRRNNIFVLRNFLSRA